MLPSTQESLTQGLFLSIVKSRAQDITSLLGYSGEKAQDLADDSNSCVTEILPKE